MDTSLKPTSPNVIIRHARIITRVETAYKIHKNNPMVTTCKVNIEDLALSPPFTLLLACQVLATYLQVEVTVAHYAPPRTLKLDWSKDFIPLHKRKTGAPK